MLTQIKTRWMGISAAVALGLGLLAWTGEASAQSGYHSGRSSYGAPVHSGHGHAHGNQRSQSARQPIYHPPSVHYDQRYHVDSYHWTPLRGLHTHGHYDSVPHAVPGHYDTRHGGHIDANPYYHGR